MPPTLAPHPRYPRQHATHPTHASTPPTLARHPRKHATHTTHVSTSPTQAHYPRHPRQHEQHAISQTLIKPRSYHSLIKSIHGIVMKNKQMLDHHDFTGFAIHLLRYCTNHQCYLNLKLYRSVISLLKTIFVIIF